MTVAKYNAMSLNELRQYSLAHREDVEAFHTYIDRSKSEGQMISLDLSDDQWEGKVKEVIRYSSKAIRWYFSSREEDDSKISAITDWWRNLDTKRVVMHHITGMEIDRATGIWEPVQMSPAVQVLINEPKIEIDEPTAFVKYIDQDGSAKQIEAVAIDLDLIKQNLFVWPTTSAEVFIFSVND